MPEALVFEKLVREDINLGVSTALVSLPTGAQGIGAQVNLATFARYVTQTWDPGNLAANAAELLTVSVPGAAVGDPVSVTHDKILGSDSAHDEILLYARVIAAGSVRVVIKNTGAGAVNIQSGTLRLLVFSIPAAPL